MGGRSGKESETQESRPVPEPVPVPTTTLSLSLSACVHHSREQSDFAAPQAAAHGPQR